MDWMFDDEEELIDAIDTELGEKLAGTQWQQRVLAFTPQTPLPERLEFYRELRSEKALLELESFFLIGWTIEEIAGQQVQEIFKQDFQARFEELEAKYHIDPEEFLEGDMEDVPEEYEALNTELGQAAHTITLATFETYGEHDMAAMYKNQLDVYGQRYLEGSESLLGTSYPGEFDDDEED